MMEEKLLATRFDCRVDGVSMNEGHVFILPKGDRLEYVVVPMEAS